jgi:hypothetical protein
MFQFLAAGETTRCVWYARTAQSRLANLAEALVEDTLSATDEASLRARISELEAKLKTEKKLHYLATRLIQERDARLELMGEQLASAYASAAAIAERRAEVVENDASTYRSHGSYDAAWECDRAVENLTWAAEEIRKLAIAEESSER